MTTARDITIYQGQAFALSLDYAGTAGRGQRMHIRLADSTATVVQILTHNGDANASVIFDTDALDITIGASVSAGWVVLADRVEWVYDIEDYDLADEDDCVIPYRGKVIVRGNRTRASDVTPSDQMPSGDGRYVRFDGVQGLSAGQQLQARENIGAGTGGGSSAWGAITGTLTDQTDLTTALGFKAPIASPTLTGTPAAPTAVGATSTTQIATTAFVGGEITTHAAATDPHGDRGYADTGLALKAPIASPTFTGVPAAPTAAGGTNTTQVATTAFVTSAVASAVAGLLEFIGNVDASSNPNYSAANKGDSYLISVAGKIGGASGKSVEVGDLVVASADNAGGTEASVGTSWFVLEHNLAGALLTANALSELSGVAATARSNLGLAIGTNVQAYDANLTTWAGITPGTGVGTALGTNVGTAGAFVTNGGALGTPSSGTLTNATGLPPAGITQSGATSSQVLAWNGSAWAPATPAAGAGTDTFLVRTPAHNEPPASAFATLDTRNSIPCLDFDAAADESAIFSGFAPEAIVLTSGIIARIVWAATSATSGNVRWRVKFERRTTDQDSDSWDAATEATDATNGTSGICETCEITCTTIDSIVAGDSFRVCVTRVGTDGTNDTMTGDAELFGFELRAA